MSKLTSTLLYSLTGAAALTSLSSCKANKEAETQKKMNIIYIMSDDHSYQTISAYDQRYIHTPNIDRIGNEGVRFTNSFVANSISGPSRACMLTGKHSHANGFINNSTTFNGDQLTFPKLLQQNGYQTAMIGKWHLVSDPQGFDHWEILPGQGDYYNPTFIQMNGERVQVEGYATNIITDKAIDWIENQRDESKPFCMLLHHKAPHRTWMPDTCDLELFADKTFPLLYLYGHVHGEDSCYRDCSSGAVLHLDEQNMPLGNNLNEKDSRGKEYAYSLVHMGGLRPFGLQYFEKDGMEGFGGGKEKKYHPHTATPTLAQFLVFEVYEDRVVFHIRNTGTHELYHRNDRLAEYTVYLA